MPKSDKVNDIAYWRNRKDRALEDMQRGVDRLSEVQFATENLERLYSLHGPAPIEKRIAHAKERVANGKKTLDLLSRGTERDKRAIKIAKNRLKRYKQQLFVLKQERKQQ